MERSDLQELVREAGPSAAAGRLIVAHLGNGASLVAIKEGQRLDTTMGLTPAGGLVMSTRVGDLDPGVAALLLQEKGMSPAAVKYLGNHQAGLLVISGIRADMQELLSKDRW
jgi:acetate kinase